MRLFRPRIRVFGITHCAEWTSFGCDGLEVRWFGFEPGRYRYGIRYARLPKVGFVESTDPYAFTFLDPAQAIRGIHFIPAFSEGRTSALLPTTKSLARILNPEDDNDWVNFYVNM